MFGGLILALADVSDLSDVRFASGPVDRSSQGAGILRLFRQLSIDVKFGVVVDVEASRSIRQAEVGAAKTMIERTEERFGLRRNFISPPTGSIT
jgi:hypothetical protein